MPNIKPSPLESFITAMKRPNYMLSSILNPRSQIVKRDFNFVKKLETAQTYQIEDMIVKLRKTKRLKKKNEYYYYNYITHPDHSIK